MAGRRLRKVGQYETFTQQKADLELRHKTARDARESDRIKAVLLRSEGWSPAAIAQALRKSEFTVCRHIDDYVEKERVKVSY